MNSWIAWHVNWWALAVYQSHTGDRLLWLIVGVLVSSFNQFLFGFLQPKRSDEALTIAWDINIGHTTRIVDARFALQVRNRLWLPVIWTLSAWNQIVWRCVVAGVHFRSIFDRLNVTNRWQTWGLILQLLPGRKTYLVLGTIMRKFGHLRWDQFVGRWHTRTSLDWVQFVSNWNFSEKRVAITARFLAAFFSLPICQVLLTLFECRLLSVWFCHLD